MATTFSASNPVACLRSNCVLLGDQRSLMVDVVIGLWGVKAEQLEVKEADQRLVLTPRHCRLGVHFGFRVEAPLPSRLQAGSQYSFELWPTATIPLSLTKDLSVVPEDFDYTASISFLDVRESLPSIDPENLSPQNVLDILLYLFRQKPGFVDRGHETNNKETAWVNAFLFRLNSGVDDDGLEAFVVEVIGSSVDKMANLR